MRFAPEVHEVNHAGSKQPIKSTKANRLAVAMRQRMEEKLAFLNGGTFDAMNSLRIDEPSLAAENLEIGGTFDS